MIVPFEALPEDATAVAGGKGASLARLSAAGLPVPRGFVVCASTFQAFLDRLDARELVLELTGALDVHDPAALDAASTRLRDIIVSNALPDDMQGAIRQAYRDLSRRSGDAAEADPTLRLPVAVRSSAVSEDGEAASFAGQQETFLNVRGEDAIARHVQACWASFFAPRALFYRAQKGMLSDTRMAVVVQEMVLAEKSGVLFTIDPIRKARDRMMIEAVFGLGEGVVSGEITPDHYVVDRESGAVVDAFVAVQSSAIVYDEDHGGTRHVELPEAVGEQRVLADGELQNLRRIGLDVERFFGAPQDIEWCIRRDELLLLQSRPITTL
jgi:pyruvate, water dikinase